MQRVASIPRASEAILVALAVSVLAACSGDASSYTLGKTFSCLSADGVDVTYHLDGSDYFIFDPIAQESGGGALRAKFDDRSVVVVFERSESDARSTESAYEAAAGGGENVEDGVQRLRNAVVVWGPPPSDEVATQITDCLGS